MNFWNKISNRGVKENMLPLEQRRILLSNQISIILALVIFLIFLILVFKVKAYLNALGLFSLFPFLITVPFLNKKGFTKGTGFLISILVPIFVLVASTAGKVLTESGKDIAFYFAPRFFIIGALVLPLMLIDFRNKMYFYTALAIFAIAIVGYDGIQEMAGVGIEKANLNQETFFITTMSSSVSLVVIVASILFLLKTNLKYEEKIQRENKALNTANTKIKKKEEKLQLANEEFQALNEELKQNNEEMLSVNNNLQDKQLFIEKQNIELENTIKIIAQQQKKMNDINKNLRDSIVYAKTIQDALLTRKGILDSIFSEYFIFFKPKEIVSGDFYYVNKIENHIVFAAADCTGHGVPGGFLTMLGITYLHSAVQRHGTTDTGEVLNALRQRIKDIFAQFGTKNQNGLDIALCAINTETHVLQYSGAYNPLIIIRDNEIIEQKATRNPIGFYPKEIPFATHNIQLKNNDSIYIFSDGYHDQLGGKRLRKFSSKRFKELLYQIHSMPMSQQEKMLEKINDDWRGSYEQLDDITIVGIKYKTNSDKKAL